jgi:hypothetical protein
MGSDRADLKVARTQQDQERHFKGDICDGALGDVGDALGEVLFREFSLFVGPKELMSEVVNK